MKYDYEILIDDQPVLVADERMVISFRDIWSDESVQDESGVLHLIPLRLGALHLTAYYNSMTASEYQYMESLFYGKITFTVDFRNPRTGEQEKRTCYRVECPAPELLNRKTGEFRGYFLDLEEC